MQSLNTFDVKPLPLVAQELLQYSDCPVFHAKVDQAVRDVMVELDLGFYPLSEASEELKAKVYNIVSRTKYF